MATGSATGARAYLEAASPPLSRPVAPPGLRLVHTALHGVGARPLLARFERAGLTPPHGVPEQAEPDPTSPPSPSRTRRSPAPWTAPSREASRVGADVVLANDPTRTAGVAVREPAQV